MSKLANPTIKDIIKRTEEGYLLTREAQETYQFITITAKQMQHVVTGLNESIRAYQEFNKSVKGIIKQAIEAQTMLTKQVKSILESFSAFNQINILVQIPRATSSIESESEPVRIFVQPDEPYKPKLLPSLSRKHKLPLTSIQIVGDGFVIGGEYIKGMTRQSDVGRIFELMIRSDLQGKISDKLFDETIKSQSDDFKYRVRSYVLRDLKDILLGHKFKLNIERYRGIKEYHLKDIIKYIRTPRKIKKTDTKAKIN